MNFDIKPYNKLAKRFGLTIEIHGTISERMFIWDGKNNIIHLSSGSSEMAILHEISHYQIAHEYRRKLPEYGLGVGPETWSKMIKPVTFEDDANTEEGYACYLTVCYARAICKSDFKNEKVFKESNSLITCPKWSWENRLNNKEFKWLFQNGFVLPSGYPTKKLRTNEKLTTFEVW